MKYLNQVITVTRWEYKRFFKPKNEAIGIVVMLLFSTIFYFVGKYALSIPVHSAPLFPLQSAPLFPVQSAPL